MMRGSELYSPGVAPCKRCGTNSRYISTGYCVACTVARKKREREAKIDPEQQALRAAVYRARQQATESGALTYTNPRPCKRGHFERYTAGYKCVQCNLLANKEWREKNPERYLTAIRNWHITHAQYSKEYREAQAALRAQKRLAMEIGALGGKSCPA